MAMHVLGPVLNKALPTDSRPREWFSNLPLYPNPDYVHQFLDFVQADDYNTTNYTLTAVGSGSAAVGTTVANGNLALTTGNAGTDSENLQAKQLPWTLDATSPKRLWFEANLSVSNVADVDAFIGLSESATDVFSSTNYIGFRITNGAASIAALTCASSTATTVTTGQSAAAATLVKLGFLFDGGNVIKFYINRAYVGKSTTNIPTATAMAITAKVKANSANARAMNIDYWLVAAER